MLVTSDTGFLSRAHNMLLAIDASNIRTGGGVTHLVEVLRAAQPAAHGVEKIFVWGCAATLARIEDRPWLEKRTDPSLEGNLLERIVWQRWTLNKLIRAMGVNLLFVPGGSIVTNFHPTVTMSRNMLPFEWSELRRFGLSAMTLRLLVLRANQTASFKKADGTIFLTRYAYDAVTKRMGALMSMKDTDSPYVDGEEVRTLIMQMVKDALQQVGMAPVSQMAMHDAMQADAINQGLQGQGQGAAPPPGAMGMAGALSPVPAPGLPPPASGAGMLASPANGNNPLGG
jgi:hypothetical protein